jgi:hypothetical protein
MIEAAKPPLRCDQLHLPAINTSEEANVKISRSRTMFALGAVVGALVLWRRRQFDSHQTRPKDFEDFGFR